MADLVTFLLNRIEEDERVAQEADPGVWTFSADVEFSGGSGNITSETPSEHFNIAYDYDREAGYGAVDANNAPHIVAWSPARVLAECAAKRRIIEEHHLSTQRSRDWQNLELPHGERKYEKFIDEETCAVCGWVREVESQWMEKYSGTYPVPDLTGCLTLRALAAPFAGHPEFDPAWEMT